MRFFLLVLAQVILAFGHGALDEQIALATAEITADPDNPRLYLNRADLHQSHRDPKSARLDLLHATRIKPPYPPAYLKLARFERKQDNPSSAKSALTVYFTLVTSPDPLAYRESALISPPREALKSWQLYLQTTKDPASLDFALAVQAAIDAKETKSADDLLLKALTRYPKSIDLHQLQARTSLTKKDPQAAQRSFKTLQQLYPNLLVKLHHEEALIWARFGETTRSRQALLAALNAFDNLPSRLQNNRDLKVLVASIKTILQK